MSDTLSVAWALAWIRGAQAVLAEHRMELIDLDRAIGDGDHGENMDRGFKAVVAKLDAAEPDDVQGVLKLVASTLMSTRRRCRRAVVRDGVPAGGQGR